MADQKHLKILNRGVAAWNDWRLTYPHIRPDLRDAHVSMAALSGVNFRNANLSGADLSGVDLIESQLSRVNLSRANLSGVDLGKTDLSSANLSHANLTGVDLSGANLTGVDLSGANLTQANLIGTLLIEVNLSGANLNRASLASADLSRADLSGADLSRAWVGSTLFANIDLRDVHGLEEVIHLEPSSIGIDTLYRSAGQIPAAFLRGCGVPDSFIEYIPTFVGALEPIQYHSCFISYSTKDEAFARRLHERMRAEHLRVWFAPEDVQGGKKLYEQIDRAIQLHDRLLLVLSEQSMQSEWVMTEIRRARRQEITDGRRKLFPIRLVDFAALRDWSCFDADHGKDLAVEVRGYFIPDFSHWKQHDAFEAAFARLLRDLRAAEA